MASLSIASSSVQPGSDAVIVRGRAGSGAAGAIVAGNVVVESTKRVTVADGNSTDLDEVLGIAVNNAAKNQPVAVQTSGHITLGKAAGGATTAVVGAVEAMDANANGAMGPYADILLAGGQKLELVGVMETSTRLKMTIIGSTIILA